MSEPQTTEEAPRFTASEVQQVNIDCWNAAVSKCREVINQAVDDYHGMGAHVVARQMRYLSLVLEDIRRD